MKLLFFGLALLLLSSCYRMPGEEDYCLIPTTNNPSVTGQSAGTLMPGTSY